MLVFVPHHEADAAACGASLIDTREEFHFVALLAGCGDSRLSRFAAVQLLLDKCHIYLYACGESVDYAANARPMRLAKAGQADDISY